MQTDSPFNLAIAAVTQGAFFQVEEKRAKLKGPLDGPYGGLTQSTNGNFYGTTYAGGTVSGGTAYGTVNELNEGLDAFVTTTPTSGKVDAKVTILGTDLTGANSVAFHGTAATFTVVSAAEITPTVPTAATSGKVAVKTPGGTLTSNLSFTVKP